MKESLAKNFIGLRLPHLACRCNWEYLALSICGAHLLLRASCPALSVAGRPQQLPRATASEFASELEAPTPATVFR